VWQNASKAEKIFMAILVIQHHYCQNVSGRGIIYLIEKSIHYEK
jgi:hypothetical protein